MNRTFDAYALGIVALIALLVGYLIGRIVGGSNDGRPPQPARPLPTVSSAAACARGDMTEAPRGCYYRA